MVVLGHRGRGKGEGAGSGGQKWGEWGREGEEKKGDIVKWLTLEHDSYEAA